MPQPAEDWVAEMRGPRRPAATCREAAVHRFRLPVVVCRSSARERTALESVARHRPVAARSEQELLALVQMVETLRAVAYREATDHRLPQVMAAAVVRSPEPRVQGRKAPLSVPPRVNPVRAAVAATVRRPSRQHQPVCEPAANDRRAGRVVLWLSPCATVGDDRCGAVPRTACLPCSGCRQSRAESDRLAAGSVVSRQEPEEIDLRMMGLWVSTLPS